MPATTIAEVIHLLDDIIDTARVESNRIGYFPALYRRVTVAVQQAIAAGKFENGELMEYFDVTFANRYLAALDAHRSGQPLSESWRVSFRAADDPRPVLLQHLLLGMNAHINLDLGLSAAAICPGDAITDLKTDFLRINLVLASLVGECVREFGKIWPVIRWADTMLDSDEDILVDFGMGQARDYAWNVALRFAHLPAAEWSASIAALDHDVSTWGQAIYHPIFPINLIFWIFDITDRKSVAQTINLLTEKTVRMQARVLPPARAITLA